MADMIEGYKVEAVLGRGGQGIVYRVGDPRIPGKLWALKAVTNAHLYQREQQVLLKLQALADPAVPRLVNTLTWQRTHGLVMTYFPGETLVGKRPGWRSTARNLAYLAALLERIHGAGLLYLDLKPENVIQGEGGLLHLIDYALAQPALTAQSDGTGTPGFAPPEQMVRGSRLSPAADRYALGALGYYLLTGSAPAPNGTSLLDGAAPPGLEFLLTSLLRPDPQARLPLARVTALQLDALEAEMRRCQACGQEGRATLAQCPHCGERLQRHVAPTPAPAPRPTSLPPTIVNPPGGNTALVLAALEKPAVVRPAARTLRLQAEQIGRVRGFEELQAPQRLRHLITFYPHQLDAAQRALREMRGNAVLADEVGLGKTIEAGLVIKELMTRNLVRRALILVPPHLTDQWVEEMTEKFDLPFRTYEQPTDWDRCPFLIASLNAVGVNKERLRSLKEPFDLIVVDEMHNLLKKDGEPRVVYQDIARLQRKYMLLLSATTIRRYTHELFYLINLIRPGTFDSLQSFRFRFEWQYGRGRTNVAELRAVLRETMIRNHRANMRREDLPPVRHVQPRAVRMTREEEGLWQRTLERMRQVPLRFNAASLSLAFSSPASQQQLLYGQAGPLQSCGKLAETVRILDAVQDQAIIFTRERSTAEALAAALRGLGKHVTLFVPGLNRSQKAQRFQLFRRTPRGVLVATDQAAEGRNLQFAAHLINFDIPWNPLRLEQRMGRIDRIGQTRTPEIYNLVYEGSFEARLLRMYTNGLHMFDPNLIIGELASVLELAEFDKKGQALDELVGAMWLRNLSDTLGFEREMVRLEALLLAARSEYDQDRRRDQEIDQELF